MIYNNSNDLPLKLKSLYGSNSICNCLLYQFSRLCKKKKKEKTIE